MSLTEDKIYRYVKQFGVILESQLVKMMEPITDEKLNRTLRKMWKKNQIKWGGPDNAYVMLNSGSDNVDMHYVDCIWVLLSHSDCEEDIDTAYKGKEMLKLSYFSRQKQNGYNLFYITGEDDYPKLSFINNRYLNATDEDMIDATKFIFVSENLEALEKMPLSKFAFPYMSLQLDFSEKGRYKEPVINIVE